MQYPDWVKEAKRSKELLSWIKDPDHSIQQFGSQLLFKSKQENCMLFYAVPSVEAPGKELRQLNFCGVLHLPDYLLYEAGSAIYKAAGIPEDFVFPTKESLKKELETKVSLLVKQKMEAEWSELLLRYQDQSGSLVPNISRTQIQKVSLRYLQAGKKPEELFYQHRFSFTKLQMEYTDLLFLRYVNHAEKAVQKVADKWLEKSLWEISQKKIYIGCVREEMKEMQKGLLFSRTKNKEEMNLWVSTVI